MGPQELDCCCLPAAVLMGCVAMALRILLKLKYVFWSTLLSARSRVDPCSSHQPLILVAGSYSSGRHLLLASEAPC